MNSGVYKITNVVNNKVYIGSSVSLKKRKALHFSDLKRDKHCNIYLQNSYNKYGIDCFLFEIIEICQPLECLEREQFYINKYIKDGTSIYNICQVAGSPLGIKRSQETKLKVGIANKKNKPTPEMKMHLSLLNKGKKHSDETKKKISVAGRGRKMSDIARLKISNGNKGKPKSPAHIEALRQAQLNSKYIRIITPEHRLKLIIAAQNRPPVTEETRKKLSESRINYLSLNKKVYVG